MRITILYRPHDPLDGTEELAMSKHFLVERQRTNIASESLVIGRYSVLPFYKELEVDLQNFGCKLINSYQEHQYVADLGNWVEDLEGYTPKTWNRLEDLPNDGRAFVLKGETNSRKDMWFTHMYAQGKAQAIQTAFRLQEDSLISTQKLYIREYVPLVQLCTDIMGKPVTKEFRFFVLDGKVLSGAFYWSSHVGDLKHLGIPVPTADEVPQAWLQEVIDRVKDKVRFLVIDVAQTKAGAWTVIELNDGQMSGLSENDPEVLYANMAKALTS